LEPLCLKGAEGCFAEISRLFIESEGFFGFRNNRTQFFKHLHLATHVHLLVVSLEGMSRGFFGAIRQKLRTRRGGPARMSAFGNPLTDYSPQLEAFEYSQSDQGFSHSVLNESEVMELTAELLNVNNEQELDQFLGDLVSKVGKSVGKFIKSPAGQALGSVLKNVAKVALPTAAGALGTFLGGPVGTMIGSSLGSMAGKALGLELEGLSPEDRDFEAARQFVRLACDTVNNALQAPPNADPWEVARAAVSEAARIHAPGLSSGALTAAHDGGRWSRRDGAITLYGVQPNQEESKMHNYDHTQFWGEAENFESPASSSVFNEDEVMELANEALEVTSEADMENFLGDLISKASHAIGSIVKSPIGQALGGVLKGAAKQLLPMAGQALGGLFGAPGAAIGGQLASAAGGALGLNEAEAEERNFESAQTLVRLAGDAVKNAVAAPPGANPQAVAKAAVAQAAQVHAPHLVAPAPPSAPHVGCESPEGAGRGRAGRWIRRGGKIILLGA
jgi:uncharacterized protein (DUF697 family)